MAAVYITEFSTMGQVAGGQQMAQEPAIASYAVAIGGASVQSPTLNPKTRFIEIHADAICSIELGINPVAVPTARRMAANQTTYRAVPEGGSYKVAVITNT